MKTHTKTLLTVIACSALVSASAKAATTIVTDDFSTLDSAWTINVNSDASGGNLSFSAVDLSGYSNAPDNLDAGVIAIHEDGNAAGTDNAGTMTRTFDLTNYEGISVSIDVAQLFNGSWEGPEFFRVEADTGSGFVPLFQQNARLSGGGTGNSDSSDDITVLESLGAAADDNSSVAIRLTFNTGYFESLADDSVSDEVYLLQNFQLSGTAIPEPGSLALLGLGGLLVASRRRRD